MRRAHLVGDAGHQVLEEAGDRRIAEPIQPERGDVPAARGPGGPPFQQLRSRHGQHEDRGGRGPFEQVVQEVQQRVVGPLQILDHQHDRVLRGELLEEGAPPGEQVATIHGAAIAHPEQLGQSGPDELDDGRVTDERGQPGVEVAHDHRFRRILRDSQALANDLGERPVGDAVAVGQAPAHVPPAVVGQAVGVPVELRVQPGLARHPPLRPPGPAGPDFAHRWRGRAP